ncbi:MAG: DUF5723 family protein [Fidelibacterota bacterium]
MGRRFVLICFLLIGFVFNQTKRDPRSVGLAGAYSTIGDGIFSVGYNPAMLAYQQDKPFMLQLFGVDFGIVGNWLSLANMNSISGDTLFNTGENPRNPKDNKKTQLLNDLKDTGGLTYFQDLHLPLPMLNYSSGNMALTTNTLILSNYQIPYGLLELMLEGNAANSEIDMTLHYEIMGVTELGFSFAVPYDQLAIGVTLKYLQGLFYMGIDPDSSHANLTTANEALYGGGVYYLRQGIGGSGIGMDIGLVSRNINGWRFGVSLINAIGSITWNRESMTKDILDGGDNIYGNSDDLFHFTWAGQALSDSVAIKYIYTIDSVNAGTLSNENLFTNNSPKDQIVPVPLDKNGNLPEFKMDYPAIFRLGMSYIGEGYLFSSDLWTGFTNSMFSHRGWRWSAGIEMTKFESVPLRLGYAWGGSDFQELALGFGYHKGPIIFDFGFAFRNGIWIHSMKGINLSTQVTITSFKSRKSKAKPSDIVPSPMPGKSEDENNESEESSESSEKSLPNAEEQQ